MENVDKSQRAFPEAVILIGHPYTGKSTWLNHVFQPLELRPSLNQYWPKIYSLDNYINKILKEKNLKYNSENFYNNVDDAKKNLEKDFKSWLKNKTDIVIDQTNMTYKKRMKLVKILKEHGYIITAIVFRHLTDDEIHARISMRPEQVVPFEVVKKFQNNWEPIEEDEESEYIDVHYI